MANRISTLKKKLIKEKIQALLITTPNNLIYLCGYTGSNGMLIVKSDNTKPIFYTDFRYKEQVKEEVKGCQTKILDRNLFSNSIVRELKGIKCLGFEANNLSFGNYSRIKKQLKGRIKLIPGENYVESLRIVKDSNEIEKIRESVLYTDKVFENILKNIKLGVTEKDLRAEIDYQFSEQGETAFPSIVAFGERGALPHAEPTNKKLKKGDTIVFDIGARINNYCADLTRTIVFGKASKKVKEIYSIVLHAQELALENISAGKTSTEIDSYARNYITEKGYGEYFGHGLGHGVGIDVHESPALSNKSNEILKVNQTTTVEPGIYLPGEFGVRIEDLVVIKEKGCENLTKSQKELIEL